GHRLAAYATIVAVLVTWAYAVTSQRENRPLVAAAWTSFGLVLVQAALGVLTVVTRLQPVLRSLHEANAALLVGSLAVLAYFAFRGTSADARPTPGETVMNYVGLTKPNVMSLLLFTTLSSMMIAAGGLPSVPLVLWTLLGGA